MSNVQQWITPLTKQCFVTLGVSLNMMQHGMTVGFAAMLLSQLKKNKDIMIDDSSSSWIASINCFGLFFGILLTPIIMARLGRRSINLIMAITMTSGWLIIYVASNAITLIVVRLFQGLVCGFTAFLCSVLIGEYTSPVYRGPFLNTITTAILLGVMVIHTTGLFLSWKNTALVPAAIGLIDIIIILNSPESPTYLAMRGRYEDCKKTFRWLRGDKEEEELGKMIKMFDKYAILYRNKRIDSVNNLKNKFFDIIKILTTKSFYMPVIIMIHLNFVNLWSGAAVIDAYAVDIYHTIIGPDADIATVVISTDIQAVISNSLSVIIVKRFRRRTMLLVTTLLNITAYLVIAGYTLAKTKGLLYFDYPLIGIILCHLHVFSLSIGPLSLPNIIDGEIFPAKFRAIGGTISILLFSICMGITLKVTPFLFANLGVYGTYIIFAAFVSYGLIVTLFCMPETKGKTLQEIEEEFVKPDKDFNNDEASFLNDLTDDKEKSLSNVTESLKELHSNSFA